MTRYRTIVADPPWVYDEGFIRVPATGRSHTPKRSGKGGALPGVPVRNDLPYPSLTVEEICRLPVRQLADSRGCRLFLWTTNRYLPHAFQVMNTWGFTYRQTLVWSKLGCSPFPQSVAPNSAEYVLVGTIGKPGRPEQYLKSVVIPAGVPKQHSAKPELFLDMFEMLSNAPRLELFARRQRLGWDTWGNEALEHVEIGGVA